MAKYPALERLADLFADGKGLHRDTEIEAAEIAFDVDAVYLVLEMVLRGFLAAPDRAQMTLLSLSLDPTQPISPTALEALANSNAWVRQYEQVRWLAAAPDAQTADCAHWLVLEDENA